MVVREVGSLRGVRVRGFSGDSPDDFSSLSRRTHDGDDNSDLWKTRDSSRFSDSKSLLSCY
ncbi:unnamed protein product [Arabidopsis lyrata]|nr:unnamed protein product [Arabidopsis lyrata]